MADSPEKMSPADWVALEALARKAAHHERVHHANEHNYDYLLGVSLYASRMA